MTVSSLAMAIGATLNGKRYNISGNYLSVFYIMIVLNIILSVTILVIGKKQKVVNKIKLIQ